MKYLAIMCLLFSGCATVSEYNQGCQDAIYGLPLLKELGVDPTKTEQARKDYCDSLERVHSKEKDVEHRP